MGTTRRWAIAAAVVMVTALGAVACSDTDGSNTATMAKSAEAAADADSGGSSASGGGGDQLRSTAALNGTKAGTQAVQGRDVISTGSLTVETDDATDAGEQARQIAEDAGGYLAKQDAVLGEDQQVKVTLRVPADAFHDVMGDVAKLGTVQVRKDDSKDVTDQVVDLEGRLDNAEVSAKRLRELLAVAENVTNIIAIEDRLTQRETEIEAIKGQLEVLHDQVDLSTVRATFTEEAPPVVSDDLPGPIESLRAGGVTLVNGLQVALAGAAFALPFVPLLLLAWWLARRYRSRTRRESALGAAGGSPVA